MSRFEDEPLDLIDDDEENSDIENKYLQQDIYSRSALLQQSH